MRWVVIVALTVIYSLILVQERYGPVIAIISGLFVSLPICGIVWVIQRLARLFREKAPRAARITGNAIFWLGLVLGIYLTGLSAYAVYQGATAYVAFTLLSIAAVYFVLGFGVRYMLRPNEVLIPTPHADFIDP
jgi:hypothetical protein